MRQGDQRDQYRGAHNGDHGRERHVAGARITLATELKTQIRMAPEKTTFE